MKPRTCIKCKAVRPGTEFVFGGKTCSECRKPRRKPVQKPASEKEIHHADRASLTSTQCPACGRIVFAPPATPDGRTSTAYPAVEVKGSAG